MKKMLKRLGVVIPSTILTLLMAVGFSTPAFAYVDTTEVAEEPVQVIEEEEGHIGTWYAIDETEIGGEKFFLLEHEEHGDMAACVAVNEHGKLVAEDLWNGFDEDFQEAVQKYFSEKWNMPKKEDVVSEIIEKAASVPDNSAQDYSEVPVYYEPFSYAKENDEVDLYRTSYRLNSECNLRYGKADGGTTAE